MWPLSTTLQAKWHKYVKKKGMENIHNAKTKESCTNIRQRRFQSKDSYLGSRMSFHNATGVNSSRGHNSHKSQMSVHMTQN